ncbi:MAG: lipid A phosphoethanolamine transferase, partial [Muribaculaceae bacterium]|nr:lipid A phosphoethanolamine transferase [Muribaculaceae bacterium]
TETAYTGAERVANAALPLGTYLLLMAAWRRNSITALCLIPVMVLCAFQIVLVDLYGGSIIAIDMFLNVVTTNPSEASELLLNLGGAVLTVCLLYLPPIVLAAIGVAKGSRLGTPMRKTGLLTGALVAVCGLIGAGMALASHDGYAPQRRLFPMNVTSNMITAAQRDVQVKDYFRTSATFSHHASDTRPDSVPEVYLLVIGETSRASDWQLNGYCRPTNPRLSLRDDIIFFGKTLSESNTTHKSVPLMMSHLSAEKFGDSIYCCRSVIDAFNEAGYHTLWASAQQRNGALIDFFGSEARDCVFLCDSSLRHYDTDLCPILAKTLERHSSEKVFAVLHTYGSHFNYADRVPEWFGSPFGHDSSTEATAANRTGLINAYDTTIAYTAAVLDSLITILEASGRPCALLYTSDHGEDIFDDSRHRFLHASPTPTCEQLHVPLLVWMSGKYKASHPEKYTAARANRSLNVSSSRSVFHTLLSLAGITADTYNPKESVCEKKYQEPRRVFLNDYNESQSLSEAGLKPIDIKILKKYGISTH